MRFLCLLRFIRALSAGLLPPDGLLGEFSMDIFLPGFSPYDLLVPPGEDGLLSGLTLCLLPAFAPAFLLFSYVRLFLPLSSMLHLLQVTL